MAATTTAMAFESTTSPLEWEEFYEQLFESPEERAEAERDFHEIVALRKILQQCEAERERAGLTKAALAQRAGMNPASLRRLLTAEGGNPTLKTMLGILEALDLEIVLRRAPRQRRRRQAGDGRPVRTDAA